MRRIIVVSGIYGNIASLEAILNEVKKSKYEEIISLGDAISYGPNPKECLNILRREHVKILLGDAELKCLDRILLKKEEKEHYKWIKSQIGKRNLSFLKKCPILYNIDVCGRKIGFAYYFLDNLNSSYPFSRESISKNKAKWTDKKYLSKYIGKNDNIKILKDSNTFLVGSTGSSKSEYASYMVIEIDDENLTTKRVRLLYDKDKLKAQLDKKNYPLKEYAKENIFFIN